MLAGAGYLLYSFVRNTAASVLFTLACVVSGVILLPSRYVVFGAALIALGLVVFHTDAWSEVRDKV